MPLIASPSAAAAGAPTSSAKPAITYPTTEQTKAEFAALCQQFSAGDDPIFGRGIVDSLRDRLTKAAPGSRDVLLLQTRLGMELRRLGEVDEAIALLAETLQRTTAEAPGSDLEQRLLRELGVAELRGGEVRNCVLAHNPASCILPIAPAAVHRDPANAKSALAHFLRYLEREPGNAQVRWLANLAAMVAGTWPDGVPTALRMPDPATAPAGEPFPQWRDVAGALGLASGDLAGGAAVDDFDGDGLLDVVTSTNDPCGPLHAFRNDGKGGFVDMTAAWGLDAQLGGLNFLHFDYDGDGMLDILVLRGGWWERRGQLRKSLLRNDLHRAAGRFVDVTAAAGLGLATFPTQTAAPADYDGDGDLDLYVGHEATQTDLYPSQLLRNEGDGTFSDVTAAAGVANMRYAKGVAWGDYDDDGDPDLYVSNLGPNRLYRNDGNGRFTDVAPELGVVEPAVSSFGTWFFDYDNDGRLDILVNDYSAKNDDVSAGYLGLPTEGGQPRLYRNEGGRFREVSRESGFTQPLLPMGCNHGDLDNDGWEDLYLATGRPEYEALMPNVMMHNEGGGAPSGEKPNRRFRDVTFAGGFGQLQKGHGVGFGDLDNDGDQDLFVQLGGQLPGDGYADALFENPGNGNHWITLLLEGKRANRFAVGARVEVRVRTQGGERSIHSLVGPGSSFGGNSLRQEIGLGAASEIVAITIHWPGGGGAQRFAPVAVDRFYRAVEGNPQLQPLDLPRLQLGTAGAPPHQHHEGGQP